MTNKTQDIVKVIQEALEKHPELGTLTPIMLDPNNLQPTLGLLFETDKGTRLGYSINIVDIKELDLKDE